jgi:hypothetical protein
MEEPLLYHVSDSTPVVGEVNGLEKMLMLNRQDLITIRGSKFAYTDDLEQDWEIRMGTSDQASAEKKAFFMILVLLHTRSRKA